MDDLFPIEQRRELLSEDETAERLRITVATLRRWQKAGRFPAAINDREERTVSYKITRAVKRIRASDLAAFLEARGQGKRPVDRAQAA